VTPLARLQALLARIGSLIEPPPPDPPAEGEPEPELPTPPPGGWLPSETTVEPHPGDDLLWDEAATFPHVGANWPRAEGGELLEAQGTLASGADHFELFVSTATRPAEGEAPAVNGLLQGLAVVETLRANLVGHLLDAPYRLEYGGAVQEEAWMRRYQWRMVFRLQNLSQ
jgi:hypothetical protein